MANSYAFVLSKNTYPDAWQANALGVHQGTKIVYAATNTLSSSTVLFADSRLTQPIYGNPDAWLGAQLLTDDAVKYALLVNEEGDIDPVSNPTTTSTTTVAPTTTTTIAPTTTTTLASFYQFEAYPGTSQSDACNHVNSMITVYANTPYLNNGINLFMNSSLTTPYNRPLYGTYLNIYFAADSQVCTMGGVSGNTIQSFTACSGITTTTTTTSQPPSSFTGYAAGSFNNACAQSGGNPGVTLYSYPGTTLVTGLPLFFDSALTSPYANQYGNWFSVGGRAYRIDLGSVAEDSAC